MAVTITMVHNKSLNKQKKRSNRYTVASLWQYIVQSRGKTFHYSYQKYFFN